MENKIKVVVCDPFEEAKIRTIDNTLEELQKIVDGPIDVMHPWPLPVCLICNEEGANRCLAVRRIVCGVPIFGTFIIVGDEGGEEFTSLRDSEANGFYQVYKTPWDSVKLANFLADQLRRHGR